MRKSILAAGLTAVLLLVVAGFNFFSAALPVSRAIAGDTRNDAIKVYAYHQYLVLSGTLVFDIRDVGGSVSQMDVTRTLLQTAAALKERRFSKIILSYRGHQRYTLPGGYFQELGRNFTRGENPMYLVRTLPENVRKMNGLPAFETWTGGILGVLNRQMEDLGEFHQQWWIMEAAARAK